MSYCLNVITCWCPLPNTPLPPACAMWLASGGLHCSLFWILSIQPMDSRPGPEGYCWSHQHTLSGLNFPTPPSRLLPLSELVSNWNPLQIHLQVLWLLSGIGSYKWTSNGNWSFSATLQPPPCSWQFPGKIAWKRPLTENSSIRDLLATANRLVGGVSH